MYVYVIIPLFYQRRLLCGWRPKPDLPLPESMLLTDTCPWPVGPMGPTGRWDFQLRPVGRAPAFRRTLFKWAFWKTSMGYASASFTNRVVGIVLLRRSSRMPNLASSALRQCISRKDIFVNHLHFCLGSSCP